jgi:hypothetical protein
VANNSGAIGESREMGAMVRSFSRFDNWTIRRSQIPAQGVRYYLPVPT